MRHSSLCFRKNDEYTASITLESGNKDEQNELIRDKPFSHHSWVINSARRPQTTLGGVRDGNQFYHPSNLRSDRIISA
jgi:hypothetical protein